MLHITGCLSTVSRQGCSTLQRLALPPTQRVETFVPLVVPHYALRLLQQGAGAGAGADDAPHLPQRAWDCPTACVKASKNMQ